MKKRSIVIILALALALSISAYAQTPRAGGWLPKITFNGTTATCYIYVKGDSTNDEIKVAMELKNGTTQIAYWSAEGSGVVIMNETATVTSGKTYVLYAYVTINGVEQAPVAVVGNT